VFAAAAAALQLSLQAAYHWLLLSLLLLVYLLQQ
jgi:hypothetical protein